MDEIALDWRIFLYTLALAAISTRNSLQWALVGTQIALSVMLLADTGLLVRSFQALTRRSWVRVPE